MRTGRQEERGGGVKGDVPVQFGVVTANKVQCANHQTVSHLNRDDFGTVDALKQGLFRKFFKNSADGQLGRQRGIQGRKKVSI